MKTCVFCDAQFELVRDTKGAAIVFKFLFTLLMICGLFAVNAGITQAGTAQADTTQPVDNRPVLYVANGGNDANTGKDPDHPKRTIVAQSNLREYLNRGDSFPPLDMSGISHFDLYAYGNASRPRPVLKSSSPGNVTSWSAGTSYVGLHSVTLDSSYSYDSSHGGYNHAVANGGNVRGSHITIEDVGLGNLLDGLVYYDVDFLTQSGGEQIGTVQGRCHFYNGVTNFTISGGSFGPSIEESPIRVSSSAISHIGLSTGTFSGMSVVQNPAVDDKAGYAIHCAHDVLFSNLTVEQAEFSFDSAGGAVGDKVDDCTVDHLTVKNSKLDIKAITYNVRFTNLTITNPTGEGISINDGMGHGSTIMGAVVCAPKHAIHYYVLSDIGVGNVMLYTTEAGAVLHDGADGAWHDLGGNKMIKKACPY